MNAAAIGMSVGALVVVMGAIVNYFSKVPEGKLRPEIGGFVLQLLVGLSLAGAAIVFAVEKGALDALVIVPSAFAAMFSLLLLYLLSQRKTPIGDLKIKIGDTLLPFEARTSEGIRFHSEELADRRILLKFFRGGW